jgi:2-hydroxychromene-2-carboxylate isomerase
MFKAMWIPPQSNITLPGPLTETLIKSNLFSKSDIEQIIAKAADKEWKDKLLSNTKDALDQGAFGAPWMWVRNYEGKEEPFFGSDRFHFMWEFLGLPWRDLEVLPKGSEGKSKL